MPNDFSAPLSQAVFEAVAEWGSARGWIGPDPYEGLNTPIGHIARGRRLRQVVVQAYKRLPFPPPRPLSAPSRPNAKALGLALAGYSTPAGSSLPEADAQRDLLSQRLLGLALPTANGHAWGYHFDVQTRHLFYGHEEPNAIATCFVIEALLVAGHPQAALAARPFLVSLYAEGEGGPRFGYVQRGSELIHNANLMVAGTLARLHRVDPDPGAAERAAAAAATTISMQPTDGVWPYGKRADLGWADSFHTAYCIDALAQTEAVFGIGGEAHARALAGWRERFFEPDGAARMYPGRRYPLETHSYASAIETLAASGFREEAERVAASAIEQLWVARRGSFAHRRTRLGLNRREFVRWTNAPMFRALARLLSDDSDR